MIKIKKPSVLKTKENTETLLVNWLKKCTIPKNNASNATRLGVVKLTIKFALVLFPNPLKKCKNSNNIKEGMKDHQKYFFNFLKLH